MTKRRRRRYRSEASPNKKAVTVFVLCILGMLLISLIVALIVGNALGNAAQKLDRPTHENEIFSYEGLDTSPINASLLSLEGQTTESALKKVNELSANSAVSICLRKDSGTFLYSSDVAAGVTGSTGILVVKCAKANRKYGWIHHY